jgi:hypothetical protein
VETGVDLETPDAKPKISAQGRIVGISEIKVLSDLAYRPGSGLEPIERILAGLIIFSLLTLLILIAFPMGRPQVGNPPPGSNSLPTHYPFIPFDPTDAALNSIR